MHVPIGFNFDVQARPLEISKDLVFLWRFIGKTEGIGELERLHAVDEAKKLDMLNAFRTFTFLYVHSVHVSIPFYVT